MWPWGHLAVGYLLCSRLHRSRAGRPLGPAAAVVVAIATQVPDLVDKPLAWWVGVLPTGRSLGHSLVAGSVLLAGVWWLAVRADRRPLGVVFAVGYLSHLAGDALYPALNGNFGDLTFLLWPLLSLPEYEVSQTVAAHVAVADIGLVVFESLLFVGAAVVWARDGYPGASIPGRIRQALTTAE
jgi:hypothetical protein